MLRILQVGLGDLGRKTVAELHGSGLGNVVAAVDPAVAGKSLSELVPGGKPGILVAASIEDLDDVAEVDAALVMTRSRLPDCAGTFRELLQAGLTVVSTCEELIWPWLRHPGLARELGDLARDRGGRLLGAGVNPGFLMDLLPGVLSAACLDVDSVRVERRIDASRRRPAFQRKVGAGVTLAELRDRLESGLGGHVGLGESLHLLAALCGLDLDDWSEEAEALGAETASESAAGPAAGIRQVARGLHRGRVVAELVFDARLSQGQPEDRIVLEGRPRLELQIPGGLHGDLATSAIALHAIGGLRALGPGLWTMGDLALSRRKARPDD
jgi:4-hydroxy-tetrahydrodipicolinate reductase